MSLVTKSKCRETLKDPSESIASKRYARYAADALTDVGASSGSVVCGDAQLLVAGRRRRKTTGGGGGGGVRTQPTEEEEEERPKNERRTARENYWEI